MISSGYFIRLNHPRNFNYIEFYKWLHDSYGTNTGRYQIIANQNVILFRDEEDVMAFKLRWK